MTRLDKQQTLDVRLLHMARGISVDRLSVSFGVDTSIIRGIVEGEKNGVMPGPIRGVHYCRWDDHEDAVKAREKLREYSDEDKCSNRGFDMGEVKRMRESRKEQRDNQNLESDEHPFNKDRLSDTDVVNVRILCNDWGYNQSRVAEAFDIPKSKVSKLARGKERPEAGGPT